MSTVANKVQVINDQSVSIETKFNTIAEEGTIKESLLTFPNGYKVSVLQSIESTSGNRTNGIYSCIGEDSLELAILDPEGEIVYDSGITYTDIYGDEVGIDGDVCGYITKDAAKQIIRRVLCMA